MGPAFHLPRVSLEALTADKLSSRYSDKGSSLAKRIPQSLPLTPVWSLIPTVGHGLSHQMGVVTVSCSRLFAGQPQVGNKVSLDLMFLHWAIRKIKEQQNGHILPHLPPPEGEASYSLRRAVGWGGCHLWEPGAAEGKRAALRSESKVPLAHPREEEAGSLSTPSSGSKIPWA